LELLKKITFQELKLHRLFAETYEYRHDIFPVLENKGFQFEGRLRDHIFKRGKWEDSLIHAFLAQQITFEKLLPNKNILITSVSKKIPLIASVKKAAQKLAIQFVHGCDIDDGCLGKYFVDFFWQCPLLKELSREQLFDYCKKHHIGMIIPTRDGELEYYASHKNWLQQNGIDIMVSDPEAIGICLDKKLFAEWLLKNKFPPIQTELSIENIQAPAYVVKERYGAGSLSLGLNLNRKDSIEHAKTLKEPIFQPYITGKEYSIDLYRDRKGQVKGCIARSRDLIIKGESQITTTVHKPILEKLCTQMANVLDLYGHAVFQAIETEDDHLYILECNPRFGGASTASEAAGLESFYWFFLESMGESLEHYPFDRAKSELRQIRYPADKIIQV
jgi:carbamoyl-phosphate synthase large subunit